MANAAMHRINPRKLLHSKWTARQPQKKEKHFMVTKVLFDEDGMVECCEIEALLTKRIESIDWRSLKNKGVWAQGWQ